MKSLAVLSLLFAGFLLLSCKGLISKAESAKATSALCLRSGVCR